MQVHLARSADERRLLWRARDQEPGVHGDAMPADARARLENVDARVPIGEADDLPHAHAELVGHQRKLVREGDVDVTEAILDQLDHFGRIGGRLEADALDEMRVEPLRFGRARRGQPADHAVVGPQFDQDLARQNALRAVGDSHVGFAFAPSGDREIGP